MAATNSNFDAAQFRDAIHLAMTMGMPTNAGEQATFIFNEQSTYAVQDPRDLPYNWGETPSTDVAQKTVSVPYAVQWAVGGVSADDMGQFDTSRGVITLLDVDYAAVKGCDQVIINGTHYVVVAWAPPTGLFEVTVYQAEIEARG